MSDYIRVDIEEPEDNYYCPDCGRWFNEPRVHHCSQSHEFWGSTCTEEWDEEECPYCGSECIYSADHVITRSDDDWEDDEDV